MSTTGLHFAKDTMTGNRFGRLVVLSLHGYDRRNLRLWLCRCDCGTEKVLRHESLRRGRTKSCGCLQKEVASQRHKTHGLSKSPTYSSWSSMLSRCSNKNNIDFERYGGRGISVCERWLQFDNFLADMGERPSLKHSIERVKNHLGYSPDNCIWGLPKQQSRNRNIARMITAFGETKCMAEWAEIYGIPYERLQARICVRGWDPERALTAPHQRGGV